MAEADIPVVDLTALESADAAADRSLVDALGTYGLVHVRGLDLDRAALLALYADFIALTERPLEQKAPLGRADLWYQRGWTPPDTEKAVLAGGQPDFKECYFAAPHDVDADCRVEYPQIYADNVWPEGLPDFQARYLAMGRLLHATGLTVLAAVARALGLAAGTFAERVEGGAHVTRLLRYLAVKPQQVERGVLWGEEHTDFNLLTLLPGGQFYDPEGQPAPRPDEHGGLYLRSRPTPDAPAGRRVRGLAPPGCLVVQVGQQLEILTGGALVATPHEIAPPKTPGYTRCSLAHFVHLHAHQVVTPLGPFRTAETVAAYRPPVLAGTYGTKTLVDIGLAPRDALDRLGYRHYERLADQRRAEGRPGGR